MRVIRSSPCRWVVGFLLTAVLLHANAGSGDDLKSMRISVQSCHDEKFEFLFNEEARRRFEACDTPLVEFEVTLLSGVGPIAKALSDDNGEAVLKVADVYENEVLSIAICKDKTSCVSYKGLSIASGPLKGGDNFILYLDGRGGNW